MGAERTFGWIQNSGDITGLKKVAGVFVKNSAVCQDLLNFRLPLMQANDLITEQDYNAISDAIQNHDGNLSYALLKGKGSGGKARADAKCSGIVQAVINAQKSIDVVNLDGETVSIKKPYTDDWSAECFIRWAVSTGLLRYNKDTDTCSITDLGERLVHTQDGSTDEKSLLAEALMTYPPVQRVLNILSSGDSFTKFEIGAQLGFVGEMGFTSIPQGYYIALLQGAADAKERAEIRSNVEGDSDKYARMIASWLIKMGWVENTSKEVIDSYKGVFYEGKLPAYKITIRGEQALKRARGNSSNRRVPKLVLLQMLATKIADTSYVRIRRAHIIQSLARPKGIEDIINYLSTKGLTETESTIIDDIHGLNNIGLHIDYSDTTRKYVLNDTIIGLEIPSIKVVKENVTRLKDTVRDKLLHVDHAYLILIDLAYSDASSKGAKNADAREFEIKTAELLTKELSFKGERLGDSNRPDVVVWKNANGIIIDNKSYKDGFNVGRNNEDEMSRYIEQAQMQIPGQPSNEWWRVFSDNAVTAYNYLFVTSFLKGDFKTNLTSLSARRRIQGGAIGVDNLLYLAESIRRDDMEESDVPALFTNDEIRISL